MAVAPASAATAVAAATDDVPVAVMAPELSGVIVDGPEYRTAKTTYDNSVASLTTVQALLVSTATELSQLQVEDRRLTTQLATETAVKASISTPVGPVVRTRDSIR